MKEYELRIKDAQKTNNKYEIKSPYDKNTIAIVKKADKNSIEQALKNIDEQKSLMKKMPAYQRADILYKVADQIKENLDELAKIIAKEGGKPYKDAFIEASRAVNTTKMSADEALQLNGEQITMDRSKGTENHTAFTIREPVGSVLAISAFNHPLNLACHQLCTAFAAGNTIIFKPASQTPISAIKLYDYFIKAGCPEGVINIVVASGSETNQMVTDNRINFITFIGSAEVGWNLQRIVNPGVRIALELGGTGTAILDKDTDLNTSIPGIVKAAYYHAGQVCVSTQILYVHEDIYDKAIKIIINMVKELKTGDPLDKHTDIGPLISDTEVNRVGDWVKDALDKGAKIALGGKKLTNNCFEPTILLDVTDDMKVVKEEVFGPVLSIKRYSDLNFVINQINNTQYAFQSAIYSKNIDKCIYVAKNIDAKACMINDSTAFRVDWMPFGGKKTSGMGVGGVRHSIYDMTDEKLIVMKSFL